MRSVVVGIAAALAMSLAGPAFGEDMTEEIQDEEQPGSEIELGIGGGEATIERESGAPVLHPGEVPLGADALDVPNDPDMPAAEILSMPSCRAKVPRTCQAPTTRTVFPTDRAIVGWHGRLACLDCWSQTGATSPAARLRCRSPRFQPRGMNPQAMRQTSPQAVSMLDSIRSPLASLWSSAAMVLSSDGDGSSSHT